VKIGGPYLDGTVVEIVGVVGDVKRDGLDSQAEPEIYTPFAADPSRAMAVLVRTDAQPGALLGSVRQRIAALDRNLPIQRAGSLEERLGAGLARRRFGALLLSIFAGLAMVLAGVGIYGLLSYWVSVRESEIAVRLALGAGPVRIVRWTGLQALRLAAIGMALGAIGAWVASRSLESMVFGIPARNTATFVIAAVAVGALALTAVAPPAWRAARTDAARRLHGA
jgi:putative ABC transport system permease protein